MSEVTSMRVAAGAKCMVEAITAPEATRPARNPPLTGCSRSNREASIVPKATKGSQEITWRSGASQAVRSAARPNGWNATQSPKALSANHATTTPKVAALKIGRICTGAPFSGLTLEVSRAQRLCAARRMITYQPRGAKPLCVGLDQPVKAHYLSSPHDTHRRSFVGGKITRQANNNMNARAMASQLRCSANFSEPHRPHRRTSGGNSSTNAASSSPRSRCARTALACSKCS